jgi:hypothetical protein
MKSKKITWREILKKLRIVQTVSNEERHKNGLKRLGQGFNEAHRLNPFNPLSYIFLPCLLIVGFFLFGIVGFFKEIETSNPFKWN